MNADDFRPRLINGKRVASSEYNSWQMMKNRCLNKNAWDYPYYGGRGITIDPRWNSFEAFLKDMGSKPTRKHTIERKDSDGPYTKDNCEWATRLTQSRNRKYAELHNGKHVWEWAKELGIKPLSFHVRLWKYRRGKITEEALYSRNRYK